ncbi:MAG: MAPEG family protein [Myxococcota bacterium]|nr:MAPEG family protein [Myxococcota bacterium]
MTTPLWCLVLIVLLPVPMAMVGAGLRVRQYGSDFDNKTPRKQVGELEGVAARLYAAQSNAWEAAILFTAAVAVAHLAGADAAASATASLVFVAARVAHLVLYLLDLDLLRSLSFGVALVCVLRLFQLAAAGGA